MINLIIIGLIAFIVIRFFIESFDNAKIDEKKEIQLTKSYRE